jgi:hypothetical protein
MTLKRRLRYFPIPIPVFNLFEKNTLEKGWDLFSFGIVFARFKVGRHPAFSIGWGWSESTPIRPWPTLTEIPTGCSDFAVCVA